MSYNPSDRVLDHIERVFTYSPPAGDQPARYVAIREAARELARMIVRLTPESREQSLALTRLEEAVMFANASIARNERIADARSPHPV